MKRRVSSLLSLLPALLVASHLPTPSSSTTASRLRGGGPGPGDVGDVAREIIDDGDERRRTPSAEDVPADYDVHEKRSGGGGGGGRVDNLFDRDDDADNDARSTLLLTKESRIVGGTYASTSDFPYLVSIQDDFGHFCGGSLIAPDVVLTAA